MPRDVTVTFEDGSTHVYAGVPEDATPEQVTARAQMDHGLRVKALDGGAKPDRIGEVKELGKDALRGVGHLGVSMLEAMGSLGGILPQDKELAKLHGSVDEALPIPEGQSTPRRYLRNAVEGGAAGLIAPGGFLRNAITGASAGLGGEAASEVSDGSPLARVAGTIMGGVAGGGGTHLATRNRPTAEALAKQALQGLPEGALEKAQALQKQASLQGVALDLAQALEGVGVPSPKLTSIRDLLANHKVGEKTQAILTQQPGQLEAAGTRALEAVPGSVTEPGEAANRLASSATQVINNAKAERSADVRARYEAAGNLPESTHAQFIDHLNEFLSTPGITQDSANAAKDTLARLKASPGTGAPTTHALDYDSLIGDMTGPYKGTPLSPADPKTSGQLKGLAGKLNETLQEASPELKEADQAFARHSKEIIDPLKQGPVGQLATPRGYKPDTQASIAKVNSAFSAGVDPKASSSAIRALGRQINKVDPEAFADATKTYYSGKIAAAFEPTLGADGATNVNAAANLQKTLFADKKQWQGMKDAVSTVAEGMGVDPTDVVKGLESFGQLVKAAANRPNKVGGLSPQDIQQMSGKSLAADAVRTLSWKPVEPIAKAIGNSISEKTLSTFDQLLTSPEGIKTLQKLGRTPLVSDKVSGILSTWAAYVGADDGEPRK